MICKCLSPLPPGFASANSLLHFNVLNSLNSMNLRFRIAFEINENHSLNEILCNSSLWKNEVLIISSWPAMFKEPF